MRAARIHALLLCFVFAIVLLSPRTAWNQSGVSLKGTVRDASGGPIQDTSLILSSADRVRVVNSDKQGYFEFAGLLPGTYELEVKGPPGFKRPKIENVNITDKSPEAMSVNLDVGTGSGCTVRELRPDDIPAPTSVVTYEKRVDSTQVIGVVHSYQNDHPLSLLPSAKVELLLVSKSDTPWVIESDVKGEFRFAALEPGKYELLASREGYWDLKPILLWVTRENLTKISLDMVLRGKEPGC
jgi:carboxypeptidase family protein